MNGFEQALDVCRVVEITVEQDDVDAVLGHGGRDVSGRADDFRRVPRSRPEASPCRRAADRRGSHDRRSGSPGDLPRDQRVCVSPQMLGKCGRQTANASIHIQRDVRIAFIIQRYGTEILGGPEYACRLTAEQLAERHDVDVLTTCARDPITWRNDYPEGADRVRGVTVRRFASSQTRDFADFTRYSEWILQNPHDAADETEWLKRQGPWSPGLIDYLKRHHKQYEALIFYNYRYAPDGARPAGRSRAQHPRPCRARRTADPPEYLQGRVPSSESDRLPQRSRTEICRADVRSPGRDRGNDRLRRRAATPSGISTPARAAGPGRRAESGIGAANRGRRAFRRRGGDGSRRMCRLVEQASSGAIASTVRSPSTAGASTRARVAKSSSSISAAT